MLHSESEPAFAPATSSGKAGLGLYLVAFFAVWTIRATLLYPIDQAIQAQSPAWRQVYADAVRILMWVVPVFVYLVRRTNSLWPSIVTHTLNNFISGAVHVG